MTSKEQDSELRTPLVEPDVEADDLKKPLVAAVQAPRPVKSGVPCWCKCVMITMGVLFLLGAVITVMVYSAVSDAVQHLTVTTPHEKYPVVEMTEQELEVVKVRVELFFDELLAGSAKEPLTITQDEINGFIGHSDYLRGNMLVTVKDGAIYEEYSLPMDMMPGGKDRFFVANDYLKINGDVIESQIETAATHEDWFDGPLLFGQIQYLVNGKDMLELYLTKGSFFGQEVPQDFIEKHVNLMEDFYNNPDNEDAKTVLEGIDHVAIEDGKIVFHPKAH